MAKKKPATRKQTKAIPPVFKPPRFDTPAFPRAITKNDPVGQTGMTLRDYFAAQALSGLIAQSDPPAVSLATNEDFAHMAYEFADAMLEARKS